MTNFLISSNYNTAYLKALAKDFDNKTNSRSGFVLPSVKEKSLNDGIQATSDNSKKGSKTNWGYVSGVSSALAQVFAGLLMIPTAFIERSKNELTELKINELPKNISLKEKEKKIEQIIEEFGKKSPVERFGSWLSKKPKLKTLAEKICKNGSNLHRLGKKFNHIGWISLGFSYLVSLPSLVGASFETKQPSMLVGAATWAAATPFMMMKRFNDSTRVKGFLMLGYSLTYLGLANKIKNDKNPKTNEKLIEYDYKQNKENLLTKSVKTVAFCIKDHFTLPEAVKNAFKQTKECISGQRKEVPDFISSEPTSDNRKITSLLLYAGGIPLMLMGNKNKAITKASEFMIGSGLFLDAIGMFAIGRKEKGTTKAVLLGGVPLRTVGDFAQTNKFMYGLRTLGGASFEYYFASLNKKQESEKAKKI